VGCDGREVSNQLDSDTDEGLFGPSSVTWRLHADPMLGVAGLRALLLQALHPLAALGVSQNSSFRTDTWGRLTRTGDYLGVTTFGSTTEAMVTGARVRAVHRSLTATDPATGRQFSMDEPELLLWVHCCLVDSVLSVLGRSGVRLTPQEADGYLHEQVRAAALVGLEAPQVPTDEVALGRYFRRLRPRLSSTAAAREEASYVIAPPIPARYAPLARPAWSAVAGLAFASLPRWARRLYSIPVLPGAAALHGPGTTVALHSLRASLRGMQVVVPPLREGPHLRSARLRLAGNAPS
jgi:uncharacterized protein (DUF2236 family)